MTTHFFRTTARGLMKNKAFSFLNIAGLAVGLASCLLIVLYVVDEISYDSYNVNASRIFRLTEFAKLNNHESSYAGSEKPLKEALEDFPEVEKSTRLIPTGSLFLSPQRFFISPSSYYYHYNHYSYLEKFG